MSILKLNLKDVQERKIKFPGYSSSEGALRKQTLPFPLSEEHRFAYTLCLFKHNDLHSVHCSAGEIHLPFLLYTPHSENWPSNGFSQVANTNPVSCRNKTNLK